MSAFFSCPQRGHFADTMRTIVPDLGSSLILTAPKTFLLGIDIKIRFEKFESSIPKILPSQAIQSFEKFGFFNENKQFLEIVCGHNLQDMGLKLIILLFIDVNFKKKFWRRLKYKDFDIKTYNLWAQVTFFFA